jgi:enoyl-[acyl-carrier-protein] reductase (NADH)
VQGVYALHAEQAGKSPQEFRSEVGGGTMMGRLPLLAEVASAATLLASDRASAMTGAIANVTCGAFVDL